MDTPRTKKHTPAAVVSAAVAFGAMVCSAQSGNAVASGPVGGPVAAAKGPEIIPLPGPGSFVRKIDNPYSPFAPGMRWVYGGGTREQRERIVVKVLNRTKLIEGITATVVRDTVKVNDEVIEDTFDWYAQDLEGRVWYLGEATKEYENGQVVSTEGSWEAGVDGAKAGIIMFAQPEVGEAYRQEFYAGHAEDQGRFLTLDTRVATKAGVFKRVRMTEDTTSLHPEIAELKFYAPGVGIVLEFDLAPEAGRTELLRFTAG
ncbi:hypothetical protein [Nocardioides zhouii]|uniref:Uncharacterized protein n=1 Tax=Nocardioides zhouii TaxID=1168729 RepID=A0A4Q2SZ44_9ACTN|nr:hypothetical protein [Nocardioides zhouii]RYC11505.1 hypothetical protein EUA94_09070 [Nocardioides zhouii]